jgi:hypothetical protein
MKGVASMGVRYVRALLMRVRMTWRCVMQAAVDVIGKMCHWVEIRRSGMGGMRLGGRAWIVLVDDSRLRAHGHDGKRTRGAGWGDGVKYHIPRINVENAAVPHTGPQPPGH